MDSLNISSSDPKVAVMQQVRQEAAVANARQLVEVRIICIPTHLRRQRYFRNTVQNSQCDKHELLQLEHSLTTMLLPKYRN